MTKKVNKTDLEKYRVPFSSLRSECDEHIFPFERSSELPNYTDEMIGQKRAVDAMEFGLNVEQSGYNLFVAGPIGTGKLTFTKTRVSQLAKNQPVPEDWCYVYNFENPDSPSAISLPAGMGIDFQQQINRLLKNIEQEIIQVFSNDDFEKRKRKIIEEYEKQGKAFWNELERFAAELSFKVERTQTGIQSYPIIDGKPLGTNEFNQLSEEEKKKITEKGKQVQEKIRETVSYIHKIEDKVRKSIDLFAKQSVSYAIEGYFQPLYEKYAEFPKVVEYLKHYFQDVVEHFTLFIDDNDSIDPSFPILFPKNKKVELTRYTVNLFINNKQLKGAPVVYETNPTFQNLFGKIEYKGAFGSYITDFTQIKPGALQRANGGYLILQATELLQQPNSWSLLKRMLQMKRVQIENPFEDRLVFPTSSMKPEPIPLNVKVILIGSYTIYELLARYDEEFHKLFKVKVEFDTEMDKSKENQLKMANFVKKFAEKEGLLPFHRRAIAKIVDYSSRLVDDQEKLSTRFQDITKILVESNYWAKKLGADCVEDTHVYKALQEEKSRNNRIAEKFLEMIRKGTIMVEVTGERVGQINGLAVMGTRDYLFGIPSKITAQTYVGKSGIVNIERETSLSGQIHHKGLLILIGYLSGTFAKNRPLPLSASITFEQTYSIVDGDSASSTELYVLLSSLANVPIKQGIAVTGSVNQWGEVQPIGGVNEKIEGFYNVCKEKGLTGEQGVIIPKQNIKNLMLDEEVVEAVQAGKFHIWAVENIAEGIEILTGMKAGNIPNEKGEFPEGTVFHWVQKRIDEMYTYFEKNQQRKVDQEQRDAEERIKM
ncbi:Lon protease family protein [Fervidibacillus halotolerans]|uniref:endopeptidase La n=1 Tax=Fervidibacillus halotolerans TaxID=2980027 RepID=A0A9E8M0N2_9BACI|nr:AAA family ATPase [Fervidibacillus halotolerans]WAA13333.1 AAA family ATPase [Fervidibacillus halotolerans]